MCPSIARRADCPHRVGVRGGHSAGSSTCRRAILFLAAAVALFRPAVAVAQDPVTCGILAGLDRNQDGRVDAADPAWPELAVTLPNRGGPVALNNGGVRELGVRCDTYRRTDGTVGVITRDVSTGQLLLALTGTGSGGLVSFDLPAPSVPDRPTLRQGASQRASSAETSLAPVHCTDLAVLDTNRDGRLNASDPAWPSLVVFEDRNRDGQRDATEVTAIGNVARDVQCQVYTAPDSSTHGVSEERLTGALVLMLPGGGQATLMRRRRPS